jgi:hypothetical protein
LEITPSLKASLADLYFREECFQKGWALASLANIHKDSSLPSNGDNLIKFKTRDKDLSVKLMDGMIPEMKKLCQPINHAGQNKDFVFSYLAYKLGRDLQYKTSIVANPTALTWVQVKPGPGSFTDLQLEALSKITLPLTLFSIRDILAPPGKMEFKWETRTGSQWLDLVDDLKEQEEYDDEYF